ncbi:MAG: hypothetical protein KGR26_15505, partial [Cyanobacteria bacterium REEB65]|nr:hypothetical protein [Cyanobacteria bacterium REEB65]
GAVLLAIPLLLIAQLPLLQEVRPLQQALRRSYVVTALSPIISALQPEGPGSELGYRADRDMGSQ